jgi:dienelactone hydrolase
VSSSRPGLLVVEAADALLDSEQVALESAGLVVARHQVNEPSDRPALRAISEALDALTARPDVDEERVAVLGLERGATLSFLRACQSGGVAALALWGGELVRDTLDAERPFQPLEMALGLEAPLLAHVGGLTPAGAEARLEHIRATLSQFARRFDIVAHARAGELLEGEARSAALQNTVEFLVEELELRTD